MPIYVQVILVVLGALFVISYGYGQWKQGKNQSKFDTNKLLKEQIDALEKKVNSQEGEIARLTKEVHQLQLVIEEKNKQLTETLAILQGRDPQMQHFFKALSDYMTLGTPAIRAISTDILPIVQRLDKFLDQEGIEKAPEKSSEGN